MSAHSPQKRPVKQRGPWLKDARKAREGEEIGAGYFVFRRGDGTNRIRASNWPFEHPTHEAAIDEAEKLARKNPGQIFDVYGRIAMTKVSNEENPQ